MRRPLFALLLLAACGGPVPADPGGEVPPDGVARSGLSFRTWNIEQFPKRPASVSWVKTIIEADPADLYGLQEIKGERELWQLVDELEDYEAVLAQPGYYTGVGVLYRPDTLNLLSARSLYPDDDWAFPRPPLDATFEVVETGDVVHVVVVHLKASLDEESRARRKSALHLLEVWARDNGLENEPLIILGDYNDELMDPEEYNVFDSIIDDEEFSFLTAPLEASGDYSFIVFESMIDHVLVTNRTVEVLGEPETKVLPLEREWPTYLDLVSDHRPVEVKFPL